MDYLAPSLMCADLLNIQKEIAVLEDAGVDWIHFDIMDLSFTTCTMLPPTMIPSLKESTKLKIDVHVMSNEPDRYLPYLLPYCNGMNVSLQVESTPRLYYVLTELKKAGADIGLAVNKGTPIERVEEYASILDMILLMNGVAGITGPKLKIDTCMQGKIRKARKILDDAGRTDAVIEVDGNISPENAVLAKKSGADAFVLGTASIFRKDVVIKDACESLRDKLKLCGGLK